MTSPTDRKRREIDHGKAIASHAEEVWRRDTRAGQQRLANRFDDLKNYLSPLHDQKLLEIGCGTGTWTRYLSALPSRITAIELSNDLLNRAKTMNPSIEWIQGDAENLPFPEMSFDYVCGLSVLHHLDLHRALHEIYRVLKPGGRMWFSEPNMLNPQILLQKNIPPLKRWEGDTPDETAFFRWPLLKEMKSHGFIDTHIRPFDFLHPSTPSAAIPFFNRVGHALENIPMIREIAGSLLIHAQK